MYDEVFLGAATENMTFVLTVKAGSTFAEARESLYQRYLRLVFELDCEVEKLRQV
jgi:hypothetical protein